MPTYVALLRGINVGGSKVIKMADLRDIIAAGGGTNVETYIQSGNVVFGHAGKSASKLAGELEQRILKVTGFTVPVVLRTADELASVIAANPYPKDVDNVHVFFLAAPIATGALGAIDATAFVPERFAAVEREVYVCMPNGMGKSKLAVAMMRAKAMAAATARNWRTVLTLDEMCRGRGTAKAAPAATAAAGKPGRARRRP